MHQKLLVSKYTAIKQLIYSELRAAISIYTKSKYSKSRKSSHFPLSQGRDERKIIYISGIALQLSKSEKNLPLEIANGIVSHISANDDKFKIQVVSPGWIHLEVTQAFLADWLQSLAVGGFGEAGGDEREKTSSSSSPSLFTAQYAHARCCSLLRLAIQEGLIQQTKPSFITPNPIPWLNCDQKLRFNHPACYRLIYELVRVVDRLEFPDVSASVNWEKAALNLSQAFETFWRKCCIFGEVKTASPELAQAKIGLLLVTQFVLKFLLEKKLDVLALDEV